MITNLLVAISSVLQTNTVEQSNQVGCEICAGVQAHGWAVYHKCDKPGGYQPATEKVVFTTITEVTTFRFEFEGKQWELASTRVVTNSCKRYALQQNWIAK